MTNVNEMPLALALGLPRDGGFGQIPTVFGSFGNTDDLPPPFGHLEFEEFNSPPVVESADTGPFFHNHTVKDLESAVAFYGTPAFQTCSSQLAIPVNISADPNDPEVQAIAAFLRVLNALENIRSSINVAERGRTMTRTEDMRELAGLSLAETIDAMQVLSQGALARRIEPAMMSARVRLLAARLALEAARHLPELPAMDKLLVWPYKPAPGAVGPGQSGHPAAVLPQLTWFVEALGSGIWSIVGPTDMTSAAPRCRLRRNGHGPSGNH